MSDLAPENKPGTNPATKSLLEKYNTKKTATMLKHVLRILVIGAMLWFGWQAIDTPSTTTKAPTQKRKAKPSDSTQTVPLTTAGIASAIENQPRHLSDSTKKRVKKRKASGNRKSTGSIKRKSRSSKKSTKLHLDSQYLSLIHI